MASKVEPNTMEIVKEPERVLRKKAADVAIADIKSARIQGLIDAMKETLRHTLDGVGLAAPQVGASLRIFIVSEEGKKLIAHKRSAGSGAKPRAWRKKNRSPTKNAHGSIMCLSIR